jgi:hypothetical protein
MRRLFLRILLSGIIAILFFACKTSEKIPREVLKIKQMSAGRILKKVYENTLEYETLTVKKVNFSLKANGKTQSLRASYKIRRDSAIQINTYKTTIPIGKLEILPDTFNVVYHIERDCYTGNFKMLSKAVGIDLDYNMLQSILSSHIFSFREDANDRIFRDYHSNIQDGMYMVSSIKERKLRKVVLKEGKLQRYLNKFNESHLINHEIYVDPSLFVVRKIIFEDLELKRLLKLEFSEYSRIGEQLFPGKIKLGFTGEKEVSLVIRLSRVYINDRENFTFRVPSKYDQKILN